MTSNYVFRKNKNKNKEAIFHISGKQISNWYDEIYTNEIIKGKSKYYIVKKNNKHIIIHVSGKQISNWHDCIYISGLVLGESEFYLVEDKGLCSVYHLSGECILQNIEREEIKNLLIKEISFNSERLYKFLALKNIKDNASNNTNIKKRSLKI